MRVTFIGGGNMGEAIVAAVLNKGIATAQDITISDVVESRRQYLSEKYGITAVDDNSRAVASGDVILLAIKPQNLPAVMAELKGRLGPGRLVLSIVAGARIAALSSGLGYDCVVRAMPNTPAQIGEGITVWAATPQVSDTHKRWAGAILGATGKEIYVDDEKYLDMVTAVSGSGPAYVFYFVESLAEAGVAIGLPAGITQELVLQTLIGSGHLLERSGRSPAELRRQVTSPGGTTEQAILRFEKGGFTQLVREAVAAAYARSKELGEQVGR